MDKETALARLRRERDYEDSLVEKLDSYVISRLNSIPDISESERELIRREITIIIHDSMRHEYLFGNMMQMVLENNEERKY
jgi:hypothetical protein